MIREKEKTGGLIIRGRIRHINAIVAFVLAAG